MNPIIAVIIGIILILIWLPACFAFEFNNKGNYEEQQRLLEKISLLSISAANISLTPVTGGSTIPASSLPEQFRPFLEGNYYAEYRIITPSQDDGVPRMESYTDIMMYAASPGTPEMTPTNYKHLAMVYGKHDAHSSTVKGQQHELTIYKLLPRQVDHIVLVKGLLEIGETETRNPYDIPIYTYEMGFAHDIREEILNRKQNSNSSQKLFGRIAVFGLLFGGLMLLITPIEALREAIPMLRIVLDPIIAIYGGMSFTFSLLVTIIATVIVYMIVNYPTISMLFTIISGGLAAYQHLNKT
jgi:hypothetical protein